MTTPSIRHLFDLDITLRDAALDMENRPTRRMIANAAIGIVNGGAKVGHSAA